MSGFVGWTTMRPMCSLCFKPMFVNERPPSSDLYTPSPQPTLRWLLFSPLPTHTVSEREGAIVTQPMLGVPWSSKIGVHDVPAFVVFHTPPYAEATYHTLLSRGSTARSTMRPELTAGPIARNVSPENVSLSGLGPALPLSPGLAAGFSAGFAGVFAAGFAAFSDAGLAVVAAGFADAAAAIWDCADAWGASSASARTMDGACVNRRRIMVRGPGGGGVPRGRGTRGVRRGSECAS
jgi:hypothetical protein